LNPRRDVVAGVSTKRSITIAAIDVLPAYGNKDVDARDKSADTATARCFDLIRTRSKARGRQALGDQTGSDLSRRHIRHKHLAERHYAFEKIFSEPEQPVMIGS
jgi:hypothetical protein